MPQLCRARPSHALARSARKVIEILGRMGDKWTVLAIAMLVERIHTPRTAEFARARGPLLLYDAALGQAAC